STLVVYPGARTTHWALRGRRTSLVMTTPTETMSVVVATRRPPSGPIVTGYRPLSSLVALETVSFTVRSGPSPNAGTSTTAGSTLRPAGAAILSRPATCPEPTQRRCSVTSRASASLSAERCTSSGSSQSWRAGASSGALCAPGGAGVAAGCCGRLPQPPQPPPPPRATPLPPP